MHTESFSPAYSKSNRRVRWAAVLIAAAALGIVATPAPALRYGQTSTFAIGDAPYTLRVHDLNGDGHLDVVTANRDGDTATVLLGDGAGGFSSIVSYPVSTSTFRDPVNLAIADFDENGAPDIAVADSQSSIELGGPGGVFLLLGDGTGAFEAGTPLSVGQFGQPCDVAAGDLNGDGHSDIVTGNALVNDMSVLLGRGDGTFESPVQYAMGEYIQFSVPVSIHLADLDGDGDLDVAAGMSAFIPNTQHLVIRLGNGDGTFGQDHVYTGAGNP